MSKTIEVPVDWLERLVVLGDEAYAFENDDVTYLKGYIESAQVLLDISKKPSDD